MAKFKEALPDQCPPSYANEIGCHAYRFVSSKRPQAGEFVSHAGLGKPLPPKADACRWASCSFFEDLDIIKLKQKAFKKLRKYGYAALVAITKDSGSAISENKHIDFWAYDKFDPVKSVIKVVAL